MSKTPRPEPSEPYNPFEETIHWRVIGIALVVFLLVIYLVISVAIHG